MCERLVNLHSRVHISFLNIDLLCTNLGCYSSLLDYNDKRQIWASVQMSSGVHMGSVRGVLSAGVKTQI